MSPSGSDGNAGTQDKPLLTLEKAQAAVRALIAKGVPKGGIAVWLRGGVYERSATLTLGGADSGANATDTVDWRGYPGEQVRLMGGKRLDPTAFQLVTNASPIWPRLDDSAKGQVLQLDLKPILGITASSTDADKQAAYGVLQPRGFGALANYNAALELFIDAQAMPLARWPDASVDMPLQDVNGDSFHIFGKTVPDVSGSYTKIGTSDGVSRFKRDQLSDGGRQYYLYRTSWMDATGAKVSRWSLDTTNDGKPNLGTDPYWGCSKVLPDNQFLPGKFNPVGTPSALDPSRINHGYVQTAEHADGSTKTTDHFTYSVDRPSRWVNAPDAWVHGFWASRFADFHFSIKSIDPVSKTLTINQTESRFGIWGYSPWYAYNLLEEITQPGEWYLDRSTGILYLWPPAGFGATSDVVVSRMETPLVQVSYAKFVGLKDLLLEATRQDLVDLKGSSDITLEGLVLRNAGVTAVDSFNGSRVTLRRCNVLGSGHQAIYLNGGDRTTLTPGGHLVENCEVHHYARFLHGASPGILLWGCGNTARHNLIHDAPNAGIFFNGNDQLIELNEIRDVCQGTSDAGAIYDGGDWGNWGAVIRNNFIHHLHSIFEWDVHGIYLDETDSGVTVEGNLLYRMDGEAIKFNGGHDNKAHHNVIVGCNSAVYATLMGIWELNPYLTLYQAYVQETDAVKKAAAYTKARDGFFGSYIGQRAVRLYQNGCASWLPTYRARGANPTEMPDPGSASVVSSDWEVYVAGDGPKRYATPVGSEFTGNLYWHNPEGIKSQLYSGFGYGKDYYAAISDNVEQDPLFVDESKLDLRLQPSSPAFGIPGFSAIPLDQIGLQP